MKRSVQLGITFLVLCGAGFAAVGAAGASGWVAGDSSVPTDTTVANGSGADLGGVDTAATPTVALEPRENGVVAGGNYKLDLVVRGVDGSVGAYDLNITASGTATLTIEGYTAASDTGTVETVISPAGRTIDLFQFGAGLESSDGNVTLGTVTVATDDAGTATFDPSVRSLTDANGTAYEGESAVTELTIEEGVPALPGNAQPPMNVDSDPLLEDVDGSGGADIFDAIELYKFRNSDVIQNNVALFDFTDDGSVDLFDAVELYNEVAG